MPQFTLTPPLSDSVPAGVMDAGYARDRRTRPELAFRLRSRAEVVVRAWRKFGAAAPPTLLDIGAAEGASLREMAHGIGAGAFVGLEMSRDLIDAAAGLPQNITIVEGDACALPVNYDGQFDLVTMLAVLEHLPDPRAALDGAMRALRRDGLVIVTCPNPLWDGIAGRLGLVRQEHHVQALDLRRLRSCVAEAGFDVLEARPFMWAPIASLTYFGVPVPPAWALTWDALPARLPLLNRLCVNAYVIARKPTR